MKIDESIKYEIACRIVEQEAPGYCATCQGEYYVDDGSPVVHAHHNRQSNPWHDGAAVISVDALVFDVGGAGVEHASFTMESVAYDATGLVAVTIAFALGTVPAAYPVPAHTI